MYSETGQPFDPFPPGEQRLLLSFVFTQRQRTRLMRDEIRASAEDYFRSKLREIVTKAGSDPANHTDLEDTVFEQTVQDVHHFMMLHGILAPIGMYGLDCVVLENETEIELITSEAPVVFANPCFKDTRRLTYTGMGDAGLQVYCPLSPRLCLLFYDPKTYLVQDNREWHASLADEQDVRVLNLLQILSTDTFVLYESLGQETMMKALTRKAREVGDWQTVPQPPLASDDEDAQYPYEPPHQLHNITPSPAPVSIRAGVEFHRRTRAEMKQRRAVWRLMECSETTEKAILKAVKILFEDTKRDFRT
ncbi:DUF4238 domain-containing protein [Haloferax sp. AS1]|uniref:DUF4238 domain-containing protein n=1 Tax=Haloferax sp. AS1 TaxID=2562277 RepID=UPI00165FC24B|nr:DUF4238 domain-containing protein [Haloferax sp. AS1]